MLWACQQLRESALDRLKQHEGLDPQEIALRIMRALEEGATVPDVAEALGQPPEDVHRKYAGAIAEAGRLGQFRAPTEPPPTTTVEPLISDDE